MRDQRGFTLLEIMIAIVILGIALIPMAGMFTTAHLSLKQGSEDTQALGVAQEIMEEQKVKHLKQETLANGAGTKGVFPYSVTVTDVDSEHKIKNVVVIVNYELNGNPRSVSLVTRMGDWK